MSLFFSIRNTVSSGVQLGDIAVSASSSALDKRVDRVGRKRFKHNLRRIGRKCSSFFKKIGKVLKPNFGSLCDRIKKIFSRLFSCFKKSKPLEESSSSFPSGESFNIETYRAVAQNTELAMRLLRQSIEDLPGLDDGEEFLNQIAEAQYEIKENQRQCFEFLKGHNHDLGIDEKLELMRNIQGLETLEKRLKDYIVENFNRLKTARNVFSSALKEEDLSIVSTSRLKCFLNSHEMILEYIETHAQPKLTLSDSQKETLERVQTEYESRVAEAEILEGRIRNKGIRNGGNTCYMNAFLQGILSAKEIRKRVYEQSLEDVENGDFNTVAFTARKFFHEHHRTRQDHRGRIIPTSAPTYLRNAVYDSESGFGLRMRRRTAQHDVGEFATAFLNEIQYDSPFKINYSAEIEGEKLVGDESSDPTPVLMVGNHPTTRQLEKMIRLSANEEKHDEENKWHYKRGDKDVHLEDYTAHTRFDGEPPQTLIVQYKRFDVRKNNKGRYVTYKVNKKLRMPRGDVFDLSPFCEEGRAKYRLKAVVQHLGKSVYGGHYVADVRHGSRWYHFDDGSSRQIPRSRVRAEDGYLYILERI